MGSSFAWLSAKLWNAARSDSAFPILDSATAKLIAGKAVSETDALQRLTTILMSKRNTLALSFPALNQ